MSHIFISYSKKDSKYVNMLVKELGDRGFDTWIDKKIETGTNWWPNIRSNIRSCAAFIVIMTPDSEMSHWVEKETLYALELKKPVLPLLLSGEANLILSDVWSKLSTIQYTDVRGGNLPEDSFYHILLRYIHPKPAGKIENTQNNIITPPHLADSILPPPFEWCSIPAGSVTIQFTDTEKQAFDVPEFYIAKYPITNAQFSKFIEAGGYINSDYWTQSGWWYRKIENWLEPRFWRYTKWNGPNFPVVGISWYEAWAFCYWLREVVNQTTITLPSEQQWQRAAQGDDERMYAWGNRFDQVYCNTSESKIGKTTPVTQYPNGVSPFGVLDMSGNVWEWCNDPWYPANRYDEKRVVARGGAFANPKDDAQVTYRFNPRPEQYSEAQGFRIVCAIDE